MFDAPGERLPKFLWNRLQVHEILLGDCGLPILDLSGNGATFTNLSSVTSASSNAITPQEPLTQPVCFSANPGGLIFGAGGGMPLVNFGSGPMGSLDGLKILNGVAASTGEYIATIGLQGFMALRGDISPALAAVYRSRHSHEEPSVLGFG